MVACGRYVLKAGFVKSWRKGFMKKSVLFCCTFCFLLFEDELIIYHTSVILTCYARHLVLIESFGENMMSSDEN